MALRKEHHRIVLLLEMLSRGAGHLPCFSGNPQATLDSLKERFCTDLNDNAAIQRVHDLINVAANNWTTTCYDRYQRCCTGVF
jgi:phosphatidylinositol kinase/protein kinase (PI-3  family)